MDRRCGSGGRVSALHMQRPEFKPPSRYVHNIHILHVKVDIYVYIYIYELLNIKHLLSFFISGEKRNHTK
jgi:hypothetical protein